MSTNNKKFISMSIICLSLLIIGIFCKNTQTINSKKAFFKNTLKGEIIFASGKDGLYLLRLPSREVENISHLNNYNILFPSYPSWSPDGTKIVLSQYRYNIGLLTIVDISHKNAEELANIKLDCDYSCWSPNGEYIAFLGRPANLSNNYYKLYVLSINNKEYHLVSTMLAGPYRPTWSPDSKNIIFSSSDNRIFIANVNNDSPPELLIQTGVSPTWSPNGNYLVFRSSKSVFLYDFHRKTESKLISNFGFTDIRDFSWSPDSQLVLYKKLTEHFSPIQIISIKENVSISLQEFGNIKGFSWKY